MISHHKAACAKIAADMNLPLRDVEKTVNYVFSIGIKWAMFKKSKKIILRRLGEFTWTTKKKQVEHMAQKAMLYAKRHSEIKRAERTKKRKLTNIFK